MKRITEILKNAVNFPGAPLMLLFGLEGILLQFLLSVNGFANNLYATNMGATASQIGIIQMIPNLIACIALLPLGIAADRMRRARTMPIVSLALAAVGYVLFATVPVMGPNRMLFFFLFLALMGGSLAIYSAQWQTFFGDVTPMERRNGVYTFRGRLTCFISILVPLLCGVLMGRFPDVEGKLSVLRVFYYLCAALTVGAIFAVRAIPGSDSRLTGASARSISLREISHVVRALSKNRRFRLFFIPMILFYISWQLDFSMWYVSEITYVGMDETALAINAAVFCIGQLLSLGYLSHLTHKTSADFVFIFCVAGLVLCPILMLITCALPMAVRLPFFILSITLTNGPQCAIGLTTVQMLLAAAPEKNRGLTVSLYTMVTTLTGSLMPYLGVLFYELIGSGRTGFYAFYILETVLRSSVLVLVIWRYRVVRREGLLTRV